MDGRMIATLYGNLNDGDGDRDADDEAVSERVTALRIRGRRIGSVSSLRAIH
jgi:hypothetical protein